MTVEKALKHENKVSAKPSWKRATEDEKTDFSQTLDERLNNIALPDSLLCIDVKCKDVEHCNDVDMFVTDILETVESVAARTLPSPPPPARSGGSWRCLR